MSPGRNTGDRTSHIQDQRKRQIRTEQVRLLYANAGSGFVVSILVAFVLASLEWQSIPQWTIVAWLGCTLLVAAARFVLVRLYWSSPQKFSSDWFGTAFAIGAGLAGVGWAAATVFLYPAANLSNQIFLVFVLGGMMLGGVSLLSARPEAFLAFIVPIGLAVGLRVIVDGDTLHLAMGMLAVLFTMNIIVTSWHNYRTIRTSLLLKFDNLDLLDDLRAANQEKETLNRELEERVVERTAELRDANERLLAENEQRRRVEDDLLRARKLESLGVLVGGIAHDFNNFLTIVMGNLGLARVELERGKPVFDILGQTEGACRRAASLASQLLTFGKGGAPVRQIVSAIPLIEDAVGLTAAGANISITSQIVPDLWSVDIDAPQVSHALQNILLNARQAMPAGGLIELRAENFEHSDESLPLDPGKYVRISVRDRGCGISPDILPRVFDPYFTTKKTGTGLGLAAAHAIIAKHRGHISVESTVGLGTTFRIYLPASERKVSPERLVREVLHPGSGRVLVMDDEEAIRILATRMLEKIGYEVVSAKDGEEAIALYEKAKASGRPFDVVLLDLTVPGGMGGKDCASKLRQLDPSVRLIVSSGYSDDPVLSEFRGYGFDAVLSKPWTVGELSQIFKLVITGDNQGVSGRIP